MGLFSILFGVALMGLPSKEGLLRNLGLITEALTRVTGMIVKITPFGVFAMTAAAAGTMDIAEFASLQVYFTTYIGACLFLTFIAFPLVVTTCTPLSYRQILKRYKGSLVMAFTTGNLFVVLPLLMDQTRELFSEKKELGEAGEYVDILVPVAFNFPNMGKLIALLFVLFGAWFVGAPISPSRYPAFISTGWVTFFGGIDLALPFMLSLMGLPADLFNIYSVAGVINGRFATLLACMELICITLITTSVLAGITRLRLRRLLPRAAVVVLVAAVMIVSMRFYLERVVPSVADQAARLEALELPFTPDMTVAPPGSEPPAPRTDGGIFFGRSKRHSNVMRIGYIPGSLPFAYFNKQEQLVGYDIEMAARLARDLGLTLEFYPTSLTDMATHLKEKRLDLVMSRITLSASRIRQVSFSEPYQQLVLGGVVTKATRDKLDQADEEELRQAELDIVMVQPSPHLDTFHAALPNATFSFIDGPREFYEAPEGKYGILLTSMEVGSAWNMIYPDFTTVLLRGGTLKKELVYAASPESDQLIRRLNDWLRLQESNGTMTRLYDYWVRGQPRLLDKKPPRWCVMRDVLGWGAET